VHTEVAAFRKALHARDHPGFAGAIERSHWSLPGHLFVRALGGHYGDYRDWVEIDAWADGIAGQLRSIKANEPVEGLVERHLAGEKDPQEERGEGAERGQSSEHGQPSS
jgi:hypothetical protein